MLILVSLLGQEIPMTGIPMQPVYQYPPDPKAGPVPPQPGFMYPPSGPAPQYPLYPAGPPIYNPAGKCTAWNPCSSCSHPLLLQDPPSVPRAEDHRTQGLALAIKRSTTELNPTPSPGPYLPLSLLESLSQAPSISPWKLIGISSHGTCTPRRGEGTPVPH